MATILPGDKNAFDVELTPSENETEEGYVRG
jgi:hypothetical protein